MSASGKRALSMDDFACAKRPRNTDYISEVLSIASTGAPTDAVYAADLTYCDPDLATVIKGLFNSKETCSVCGSSGAGAALVHASYCCRHVLCATCVCSAVIKSLGSGRCPRCPKCPTDAKDVCVDEWKRGYSAYVPERSRGMLDPICTRGVDASMYSGEDVAVLKDESTRTDHMLRFRNWVVDPAYEEGSWADCPMCRTKVYNYTGADRVARCPNPDCAALFCIECRCEPHPGIPCTQHPDI